MAQVYTSLVLSGVRGVTLMQRAVLLVLADHANAKDDGVSYPSTRTIADELESDRRNIQRTLRALESLHWISPVGPSRGGVGHTTRYRLNVERMRAIKAGRPAENGGTGDAVNGGTGDAVSETERRHERRHSDAVNGVKRAVPQPPEHITKREPINSVPPAAPIPAASPASPTPQPLNPGFAGTQATVLPNPHGPADSTPAARAKGTPIPEGFTISRAVLEWAAERRYGRLNERLDQFVSACRARDYRYVDWDAAFRNAIAQDWARLGGPEKPRGLAL